MSKLHSSEAWNLASKTLPFLMITVTFISIAFSYGYSATQYTAENVFEASKINLQYWL